MENNQRTVLIVDDCPEDRETYRRYLLQDSKYTYTILEEEDGENGLALCSQARPDAILLDFLLPDIDGLKFINELKIIECQTNLPVVMLTGNGNEAIAVAAMKSGACDYLVKGKTTPESLRLAIHNVMERLNSAQDGDFLGFEFRRRQMNEEWRWLCSREPVLTRSKNDSPLQIQDTTGDITKHKQSEAQLRDSEECLRLAVEGAALGTWQYDIPCGRISCSQRCKAMFGLVTDKADLNYDTFMNCLHQEDRQRVHQVVAQAIENREDYDIEYRVVWPDGSIHWIVAKGRIFYNESSQPLSIIGIVQDISDRKQIEEERHQLLTREQAARAAAEAADRAKDEFLTMVSHELRTPLTAILGYTQLLQTERLNEAIATRALETIEDNAKLQAQLIDDLLDISRIIAGKFSLNTYLLDLTYVIEAAIDTVYLAAQAKEIHIEPILDLTGACVVGDVNRLQQVFWNLLSNAIKFTPKGGLIQVRSERIDSYVHVTISDTGRGISAEFLPYIFNRFWQAKSTDRQGGLGLGLTIVHHLVELHGGTVDVLSDGEGKGTTFTVKLPAASAVRDTTRTCTSIT